MIVLVALVLTTWSIHAQNQLELGDLFDDFELTADEERELRIERAEAMAAAGRIAEAAKIFREVLAEAEAEISDEVQSATLEGEEREARITARRAKLLPWRLRLSELETELGYLASAAATLDRAIAVAEAQLGSEHIHLRWLLEPRRRLAQRLEEAQEWIAELDARIVALREKAASIEQGDSVLLGGGSPRGADLPFRRVGVFYGTNRAREGAEPERFYGGRRGGLELGVVTVSLPRKRQRGSIPKRRFWPGQDRPDRSRYVVVESVRPYRGANARSAFEADLRRQVYRSERREVLVFIHGYNVSFREAAERSAQLAVDLEIDGAPMMYSWPSAGEVSAYVADGGSLVPRVVDGLKTVLRLAAMGSGATKVHIVAHSMGNRYLLAALEDLEREGVSRAGKALFDNVVWASPDVDAEGFTARLPEVAGLAQQMTLYASERDRAIALSRHLHGGYPRAGDARAPMPLVTPGLTTVNTSEVTPFGLGHADFAGSAFDDLRAVIWLGLEPAHRCVLARSQNSEGKAYWTLRDEGNATCEPETFSLALDLMRWLGPAPALEQVEERVGHFRSAGNAAQVAKWSDLESVIRGMVP